jgi:hypothetical protein
MSARPKLGALPVLTSAVAGWLRLHCQGRTPDEAVPVRCSVLLELLDRYEVAIGESDRALAALTEARAVLAEYADPAWYAPVSPGRDPGVVFDGGSMARDALTRLPVAAHIRSTR